MYYSRTKTSLLRVEAGQVIFDKYSPLFRFDSTIRCEEFARQWFGVEDGMCKMRRHFWRQFLESVEHPRILRTNFTEICYWYFQQESSHESKQNICFPERDLIKILDGRRIFSFRLQTTFGNGKWLFTWTWSGCEEEVDPKTRVI